MAAHNTVTNKRKFESKKNKKVKARITGTSKNVSGKDRVWDNIIAFGLSDLRNHSTSLVHVCTVFDKKMHMDRREGEQTSEQSDEHQMHNSASKSVFSSFLFPRKDNTFQKYIVLAKYNDAFSAHLLR